MAPITLGRSRRTILRARSPRSIGAWSIGLRAVNFRTRRLRLNAGRSPAHRPYLGHRSRSIELTIRAGRSNFGRSLRSSRAPPNRDRRAARAITVLAEAATGLNRRGACHKLLPDFVRQTLAPARSSRRCASPFSCGAAPTLQGGRGPSPSKRGTARETLAARGHRPGRRGRPPLRPLSSSLAI